MCASEGILEQSSSFGAENIFHDVGFPFVHYVKKKKKSGGIKNPKHYFTARATTSCEMKKYILGLLALHLSISVHHRSPR